MSDPAAVIRQVLCFVLEIQPSQLEGTVLDAAIEKIAEGKREG